MHPHVAWLLELEIAPGRDADFRALMSEMIAATEANEPGTLSYEWSRSADGERCHIYERYADSAAAMTHLGTFGQKYAERFMALLKPVRLVVYGSPSAEVMNTLAPFGADFMEFAAGFSR